MMGICPRPWISWMRDAASLLKSKAEFFLPGRAHQSDDARQGPVLKGVGLAVAMSIPRKTSMESPEMISPLSFWARRIPQAVFPVAVGPRMTTTFFFCGHGILLMIPYLMRL